MRRALLAGACAAALWAGGTRPARAVLGVGDTTWCLNCTEEWQEVAREVARAAQVVKQIEEARAMVARAEQIYRAATGVRDLGSAIYALNLAGVQNPLPVDAYAVQNMIAGRGGAGGTLSGLYDTLMGLNRVADPAGDTFRGQEMAANAGSIAGMQALAQQTYQANAERLQRLAGVRERMAIASDPAEVAQLHLAVAATEADLHAQQVQLQGAHVLFVSAQAMRAQRSAEHEDRCLRIVVAYFQNGGGSLNCPSTAAAVSPVVAGNAAGGTAGIYAGASGASDGKAMDLMLSQPWGEAAVANARQTGINPEALAATCAIESGCRNLQSSTSSAGGAFQVIDSTWREQTTKVGVSTDLSGKADGGTSSLVAANYLSEQGRKLQQYGIDTPTVGQARALYQFGGAGMGLATAPDSAVVSSVMPGVSADTLRANGVTAGVTTAGEWRARDRAKAGSAFDAPLFPTSNT